MPTYQYRCTECGRDLEVVQKFSDPSLTVCPTCSGALRKVFNAVGVVFKGSGFYRTDSRAGSRESASDSDGGTGKNGDSGDKSGEKADKKSGEKADKTSTSGDAKPSEAKPTAEAKPKSESVPSGAGSSTSAKAATN